MTITRPRVGLALAGGVVRAPIHVGALSYFKSVGLPVDVIAGTSFGALAGAVYAAGKSVEDMRRLSNELKWTNGVTLAWPGMGLLRLDKLDQFIVREFGDIQFSELKIPLAVVAAEMITGEQVVLREGRLASALTASSSLPGLFYPVQINGRYLVDGAICNNLPITVARSMGADYVIAIDAKPNRAHRPNNVVSLFLSTLSAMVRNAADDPKLADIYICPTVERTGGLSMPNSAPLIELGRQAAEAAMPAIRAALNL